MSKQTETATHDELLAGLTEEERAALAAPDVDDDAPQEGNANDEPQNQAIIDDKESDPPVAAPATNVPAAVAAPAVAEPAPVVAHEPSPAPSAPLLVIEAPADADAKLADLASQKDALSTKFDDGDLTTKEFQAELDRLNKAEREIERAVDASKIAASMETQRQKNDWDRDCSTFLSSHPDYHGEQNAEAFAHLNETIIAYAKMPRNANLSGPELLDKAHRAVMAERGTPVTTAAAAAPAAKAATAAIPKPATPPSLHAIPAAQQNEAGEGRFSALAKLNGFELEAAMAKMSAEDREAFMQE